MNTVIFGGSFNPVHNGHLELARAAARLPKTDRILILPDFIPPHKQVGDDFASASERLEMCRILSSLVEKSEVCDIELRRGGRSYMYDTVTELESLFPEDDFFLLVGGDMLVTLDSWYKSEELLKKVGIIAAGRGDLPKKEIDAAAEKLRQKGCRVISLPDRITPLSSTEIRAAITAGESGLPLPTGIEEYINEHGLYKRR